MSESGVGPGAQAIVVFAMLATFALLTTAAVVAVGVGPVADAVPDSSSMPDQPGEVVGQGETVPAASVSGTVTAPNGSPASDATVVLAPHPAPVFEKATPGELAAIVDDQTDSELTVVRTDADGTYVAEVPSGEYDVIALRDGNVSEIRTLNASDDVALDLALAESRSLTYESRATAVRDDGTATVSVAVYNRDDAPRSFSVSYFPLPDDWTIVEYRSDVARVNASTRTFHFRDVPTGSWAHAELVVRAPADATPGSTATFGATASTIPRDGDEVAVTWRGTANVSVPVPDASESTTHLPGTTDARETPGQDESSDDAGDGAGDDTGTEASGSSTTAASTRPDPPLPGENVPGFGLALALACTTLVIAVFAARQQS